MGLTAEAETVQCAQEPDQAAGMKNLSCGTAEVKIGRQVGDVANGVNFRKGIYISGACFIYWANKYT